MNKNKLLALTFLILSLFTSLLSLDSLYFCLTKKEIEAKVVKIDKTKYGDTSIKLEYKRNNDIITVSKTFDNLDSKRIKLFSNVKIYYNELWKNEFIIKNKNSTQVFIYEILLFAVLCFLFFKGFRFYYSNRNHK
jgi:hypothetical protein